MRLKRLLLCFCLFVVGPVFSQPAANFPKTFAAPLPQSERILRPTQAMRMHFFSYHGQDVPPVLSKDFIETALNSPCHRFEDFYPPKAQFAASSSAQPAPKTTGAVQLAWAAKFGSGMAPSQNWASDIAVDANGDVYVTGSSVHPETDRDMYTAKYSAAGALLWEARYHDPLRNSDEAHFIAIDEAGFVYVLGQSEAPFTTEVPDVVVLIKYDTNGVQQWLSTYAGEIDGNIDYLEGMALDSRGNICYAGTFRIDGSTLEFIVLKYNPQGEKLWHRRYAEPKNINLPDALVVDVQDNVIVAGRSAIDGDHDELAIVKYDSAGNKLWAARSSENFGNFGWVNAIATDRSGNIFVVGRGDLGWGDYSFYITKFTADGRQDWIRGYEGPGQSRDNAYDVVVDDDGNIFVTGESQTGNDENEDFATLKYDNQGNLLWEARYDGPVENSIDRPRRLALTGDGGVCVTGYSTDLGATSLYTSDFITIAYDANGNEKWLRRYDGEGYLSDGGHALAADSGGNIIVTGTSNGDFLTIKYDATGNAHWTQRYHIDGLSDDTAVDMAYDFAGNTIVLASSAHKISGNDLLLLKYDPSGNLLWQWRYDSGDHSYEQPVGLEVDAHGDAYAVATNQVNSVRQIVLVKVSAAGELLWEEQVVSPEGADIQAHSLKLNVLGHIFLLGSVWSDVDPQGFLLVKFRDDGSEAWKSVYRSPNSAYETPGRIAVSSNGDVFLFGHSHLEGDDIGMLTIKYSADGELQWADHFTNYGQSTIYATTMAVDQRQNAYVMGSAFSNDIFGPTVMTLKYSPEGKPELFSTKQTEEGIYLTGSRLQIDNSGNPVLGIRDGRRRRLEVFKFNSSGEQMWQWSFAPQNIFWAQFRGMEIDGLGNIYNLIEQRQSGPGQSGYVAIKLTPKGEEAWRVNYVSPGNQPDDPQKLLVDGWGNVFMTGEKGAYAANSTIHTVKYVQDELADVAKAIDVTENYPNPFNAGTNIRYTLEKTGPVKLVIYNTMGQAVETLVDAVQSPGVYVYNWAPKTQASGVYFYRWQAGGVKEVKKLLLVK